MLVGLLDEPHGNLQKPCRNHAERGLRFVKFCFVRVVDDARSRRVNLTGFFFDSSNDIGKRVLKLKSRGNHASLAVAAHALHDHHGPSDFIARVNLAVHDKPVQLGHLAEGSHDSGENDMVHRQRRKLTFSLLLDKSLKLRNVNLVLEQNPCIGLRRHEIRLKP